MDNGTSVRPQGHAQQSKNRLAALRWHVQGTWAAKLAICFDHNEHNTGCFVQVYMHPMNMSFEHAGKAGLVYVSYHKVTASHALENMHETYQTM